MGFKPSTTGPQGQLYADPKPTPDEDAFQVNNTSEAYYNSPYYLKNKNLIQQIPPPRPGVPLAQMQTGEGATVHGVTEEVPEILRYLSDVGLRPGSAVNIIEKAPLGGPVTVEVSGERHAISLELARMVTVVGI